MVSGSFLEESKISDFDRVSRLELASSPYYSKSLSYTRRDLSAEEQAAALKQFHYSFKVPVCDDFEHGDIIMDQFIDLLSGLAISRCGAGYEKVSTRALSPWGIRKCLQRAKQVANRGLQHEMTQLIGPAEYTAGLSAWYNWQYSHFISTCDMIDKEIFELIDVQKGSFKSPVTHFGKPRFGDNVTTKFVCKNLVSEPKTLKQVLAMLVTLYVFLGRLRCFNLVEIFNNWCDDTLAKEYRFWDRHFSSIEFSNAKAAINTSSAIVNGELVLQRPFVILKDHFLTHSNGKHRELDSEAELAFYKALNAVVSIGGWIGFENYAEAFNPHAIGVVPVIDNDGETNYKRTVFRKDYPSFIDFGVLRPPVINHELKLLQYEAEQPWGSWVDESKLSQSIDAMCAPDRDGHEPPLVSFANGVTALAYFKQFGHPIFSFDNKPDFLEPSFIIDDVTKQKIVDKAKEKLDAKGGIIGSD
jgi:hypothetical protein